ncbi:MAG: DUF4347 domain-containing protein, partial [Methylocystaceae bacterium]|nr:DUF4347 domain-containing protein [Methylocystaceae bacterium]
QSLSTAQIASLSAQQIVALTTDQIRGLTPKQITALTTGQMTAFTTSQLASLDTAQVNALSSIQIATLTQSQIVNFITPSSTGSSSGIHDIAPIAQKIAEQGYLPDNQIALFSYLSQTPLNVASSTAIKVEGNNNPSPPLNQNLPIAEVQSLTTAEVETLSKSAPKPFATTNAVAFVDSQIDHSSAVIADLRVKGVTTFLIDQSKDGLTQIADNLRGISGISSIHIFSHANSGVMELGSGLIDQASLATHTAQLQQIGNSLTENGDILLYGCDLAANEAGQNFIAALSQATHADIAASLDETGSKTLGGNWTLESSYGAIESQSFEISGYQSVLLVPTSAA